MLPQALGPFEDLEIKAHAKYFFEQFDFIFPREAISKQHVLNLGVEEFKVKACPDISHLLEVSPPEQSDKWSRRVAIVPNARMLDKTELATASQYLNYLLICIERVKANNLEPVILIHETNDDSLTETLLERLENKPEVFTEDGKTTKSYLGACYANIGSRYHSLVSSLSQGVPSLGTSWAHKYEVLFSEYECEEYLISPALDNENIVNKLDAFLDQKRNSQLRDQLKFRAAKQKAKVEAMWKQVNGIISQDNVVR